MLTYRPKIDAGKMLELDGFWFAPQVATDAGKGGRLAKSPSERIKGHTQ
jgi:hypothetical protein